MVCLSSASSTYLPPKTIPFRKGGSMGRTRLFIRADLERQREAKPFQEEAVQVKEYPQEISFPGSLEFQTERAQEAAAGPQFSEAQKAFLERKAAYLAGTGPLFPKECMCDKCDGQGFFICDNCGGTGVNSVGSEELMGCTMDEVQQRNGVTDVRWMVMKGGPCFVCLGKERDEQNRCYRGCKDCEGTGFAGGISHRYVGD